MLIRLEVVLCQHGVNSVASRPCRAVPLVPQREGSHTVVTKPLRIDFPILRGQQSRTSSVITNSINRKTPHRTHKSAR